MEWRDEVWLYDRECAGSGIVLLTGYVLNNIYI